MGELSGKNVWKVYYDLGKGKVRAVTVLGKAPEGAVVLTGKGSAYGTAKVLSGRLQRAIQSDIGIVDVTLRPGGKRGMELSFKPDPDMSHRAPKISERQAIDERKALRLSQRASRLGRSRVFPLR